MSTSLNKEQKNILKVGQGKPILVFAGPASGKTLIMVERIKKVIDELGSEDILVFTVRKKTCGEIKKRLNDRNIISKSTNLELKIRTFNSFGFDFAKRFLKIKYGFNAIAISENLAKKTIKKLCEDIVKSIPQINGNVVDEIMQLIDNITIKCHLSEIKKEEVYKTEEDRLMGEYIRDFVSRTNHIKDLNSSEVMELHREYFK